MWRFAALCLLCVPVFAERHPIHNPKPSSNPPTMVVRVCSGTPTTQGWSACSGVSLVAYWTYPAPWVVLDVLRVGQSQDIWITPDQLVAGDRVFVCLDPSIVPGQWVACPMTLPGQSNNWMDASKVDFSHPALGQLTVSWNAPTQTDDVPPQPITKAMTYEVYTRSNNCGGGIPPNPSAPPCQGSYATPDRTTTELVAQFSLPVGPWCVTVDAFWTGTDPNLTRGQEAMEVCPPVHSLPAAPVVTLTLGPQISRAKEGQLCGAYCSPSK